MRLTPSEIGARAEAAVAAALVNAGKDVYGPLFGAHSRVALIFGDKNGLHRVQCKTARVSNNAVFFRTSSNTANVTRDYVGEVDFFGVYSPTLYRVFLVPAEGLPATHCYLRLAPARHGQTKRIRLADDYALEA